MGLQPIAIAVTSSLFQNPKVYVANSGSDSVTVIELPSSTNMKDIRHITVGKRPRDIGFNEITSLVYIE